MKTKNNNALGVHGTLGSHVFATEEREQHDFYATDPLAVELLLQEEKFSPKIWECACGAGHISRVLEQHGYDVLSTDLYDRGFGEAGVNFLDSNINFDGDIVSNPPYSEAEKFVRKALETVQTGGKVAMLLRLLFLEGQKRKKLFEEYPPNVVYVFGKRARCAKGGDFERYTNSMQAFAWFVWEKGYVGDTVIRWIN